jgi:hypothetical protein
MAVTPTPATTDPALLCQHIVSAINPGSGSVAIMLLEYEEYLLAARWLRKSLERSGRQTCMECFQRRSREVKTRTTTIHRSPLPVVGKVIHLRCMHAGGRRTSSGCSRCLQVTVSNSGLHHYRWTSDAHSELINSVSRLPTASPSKKRCCRTF